MRDDLQSHGDGDEASDADDRQLTVVSLGTEEQKGDDDLPHEHDDFPVAEVTALETAIEKSRGLVDPALDVGPRLRGGTENDDQEDEEAAVDDADEEPDEKGERPVVVLEALETGVHRPVADALALQRRLTLVHVHAEQAAECRLHDGDRGDVPQDHDGEQTSHQEEAQRVLDAVVRRDGDPEETEQKEDERGDGADGDEHSERRWMQRVLVRAQTHDRSPNAFRRKTAEELCTHTTRLRDPGSDTGFGRGPATCAMMSMETAHPTSTEAIRIVTCT